MLTGDAARLAALYLVNENDLVSKYVRKPAMSRKRVLLQRAVGGMFGAFQRCFRG